MLSLFLVFSYSPLQLYTFSIKKTGMRESLTSNSLVAALQDGKLFTTVFRLSLFLFICSLLRLRVPTVKGLKMWKSLSFGVFVVV